MLSCYVHHATTINDHTIKVFFFFWIVLQLAWKKHKSGKNNLATHISDWNVVPEFLTVSLLTTTLLNSKP